MAGSGRTHQPQPPPQLFRSLVAGRFGARFFGGRQCGKNLVSRIKTAASECALTPIHPVQYSNLFISAQPLRAPGDILYVEVRIVSLSARKETRHRHQNGQPDTFMTTARKLSGFRLAILMRSEEHTSELQSPCN